MAEITAQEKTLLAHIKEAIREVLREEKEIERRHTLFARKEKPVDKAESK